MKNYRFGVATAVFVLLSLVSAANAANSGAFSTIVVFGDSLSDTGNAAAFVGETAPNPPYYEGTHATNGPVAVEVLAEELEAKGLLPTGYDLSASEYLLGPAKGTNYAVLGARASGLDLTYLTWQVTMFLANTGGVAPSNALYVVFIGGNDIRDARDQPGVLRSWLKAKAGAASELTALRALALAGAKHLLVVNVPNIGAIPETLQKNNPSLSAKATWLAQVYNSTLDRGLDRIRGDFAYTGLTIAELDVFSLLNAVVSEPQDYDFDNSTDSCLAVYPISCDFDQYVFFDDIHPTAKMHGIIGQAMVDVITPASATSIAQ